MRVKVLTIALLATIAIGCKREASFHLSGNITASPQLQGRMARPNTVLSIIVVNKGGVPIAVKRIINPRLPLYYEMNDENLILPGEAWEGPLTVRVQVNKHGKIGKSKRGDLRGMHRGTAHAGNRHVDIVIDEQI